MQQGVSFIQIIHQGAIATYPLILLSIVSVAVVLERFWSLRDVGATTRRLTNMLADPANRGRRDLTLAIRKQNTRSPAARVFLAV